LAKAFKIHNTHLSRIAIERIARRKRGRSRRVKELKYRKEWG